MTPAVKVRHPNHWTAREVLSFPSLFCPTLLLHRRPPVSLLSLSLSHTPNPLSTHTHHKSVSGKVSHLHRTRCTPVFVSPTARNGDYTPGSLLLLHPSPLPPPNSRYFDFVLVCDPGTVGLFPPCPHLFSATGSLVPSALQPFQALFTLVTLRESLSLPQVPVARTALRKARTSPCPQCPTAPAQGYSAGCRQDSP